MAELILVQIERHHGEPFATWFFLNEIKDILGVSVAVLKTMKQTNQQPTNLAIRD